MPLTGFSHHRGSERNWSCKLDVVFLPTRPKEVWYQLGITQGVQPDASDLTHDHRRRRRVWTGRRRNWNHQYWSHVIFTDESRCSLYHCDGRARVLRHVDERLAYCCIGETNGNVGASPMVLGTFQASGKSQLVVVDGTVNHQRYIGISCQNLHPWPRASFQRKFVLVHNNATSHTARKTSNFLAGNEVEIVQWPAPSPDLNPIEHIWDHLGLFIRGHSDPWKDGGPCTEHAPTTMGIIAASVSHIRH